MPTNLPKPPCATWKIWVGAEVEGTEFLGMRTLFIRDMGNYSLKELWRLVPTRRIWFCREFQNFDVIREALLLYNQGQVCVEYVYGETLLPSDIWCSARIYAKLPFCLKPGDFICHGVPFNDEAFRVGEGKQVSAEDYAGDTKIL